MDDETVSHEQERGNPFGSRFCCGSAGVRTTATRTSFVFVCVVCVAHISTLSVCVAALAVDQDQAMPEARRREVDVLLRGLAPKHQRQLSVSTSNALERFAVLEVCKNHSKVLFVLFFSSFFLHYFSYTPL